MPQTFPMALADFFEGLPIRSFKPDLTEAMAFSRTKGGEVLTADMGPRLWTNEIIIGTNYYNRIERVRARLNLLRSAGRSLLVHSMPLKGPQYDPLGSILGLSVITLDAVAANNREINLKGFPPAYKLRPGDCLSFTYGSNPLRYAMHQVVNTNVATADPYGTELRAGGAPNLLGAATAATYNTGTGVGSATRVDGSNVSTVQFTGLTVGQAYRLTVTHSSGAGNLAVRRPDENAPGYGSFAAGSGTTSLDFTASHTNFHLAPTAGTIGFTVVSLKPYVGTVMNNVEVVDFIRPGFTLGTTVQLIKPTYKAIVLPGSTEVGQSGDMVTEGLKFTVMQTLGR